MQRISHPIEPTEIQREKKSRSSYVKAELPDAAREAHGHGAAEFPRVIGTRGPYHDVAFMPPYKGASSYYPLCG
jgi:hypothetical protein